MEKIKIWGRKPTCKIHHLPKGYMKIPFLSKGEKGRKYKLQLFPADRCKEQPSCLQKMLKHQEAQQAKSSQFFLTYYWTSPVLQNLKTRPILHRKRQIFSSENGLATFSSLGKALGFLCFQYGFTLHPSDLLESLQSTISICCKKPVIVRNLSLWCDGYKRSSEYADPQVGVWERNEKKHSLHA